MCVVVDEVVFVTIVLVIFTVVFAYVRPEEIDKGLRHRPSSGAEGACFESHFDLIKDPLSLKLAVASWRP